MKIIKLAPLALIGLSTAVFAGQSLYRHPTPHDPVSPDLEAVNMLRKGQVKWLAGRDARGQAKFVEGLFGVAA